MKWIVAGLLTVTLVCVASQPVLAAQGHGFPYGHPNYEMYRLQHANPYAYGMPQQHFRWGWFGAAPRIDSTRERGEHGHHHWFRSHHIHNADFHQWTHRRSY